jgi:hypothetical protein
MLCALFAVGTEAARYSVMGKPRCRRKGTDLIYRVISTEQGKPVSLLERGRDAARPIDGDAGIGNERKRRLRCNSTDRGCVASLGQQYLAGNGAHFSLVLELETICRTEE